MCGGEFAFKNRLCWLIVGRKFTIFSLSYFEFESTVLSTSPRGGLYSEGPFNRGFCFTGFAGLCLEGLIFGILQYFFK